MFSAEVQRAVVEEHARDEPPPLALREPADAVREQALDRQRAVLEDPARVRVEPGAHQQLDEVDGDVDPDESQRHPRAPEVERPARSPRRALRRRLPPAGGGVVGAADADRPERHAVRADASSALRARHIGLPVRMPVAAEGLAHRGLAYKRARPRRVHSGRGRRSPDRSRHRRDPRDDDDLPGPRVRLRARLLRDRGRGGAGAPRDRSARASSAASGRTSSSPGSTSGTRRASTWSRAACPHPDHDERHARDRVRRAALRARPRRLAPQPRRGRGGGARRRRGRRSSSAPASRARSRSTTPTSRGASWTRSAGSGRTPPRPPRGSRRPGAGRRRPSARRGAAATCIENAPDLEDDLGFCARESVLDVVPRLARLQETAAELSL